MRIGILGGTFDPVHYGHLTLAEEAAEKIALEKVLFMPANRAPLKGRNDVSPARYRTEMLRLAIRGKKGWEICEMELERVGLSYTIDTIRDLKKMLQAEDEIYFIMGWDSFAELPEWKQSRQLVRLCRLIVFNRPPVKKPDLMQLEKVLPGLSQRVDLLEMPPMNISSTEIRNRVKQELPVQDMVPPEVERYIRKHKLYSS